MRQREELEAERRRWSNKLEKIEQFVLGGMGRSVVEYTLQVRYLILLGSWSYLNKVSLSQFKI